MCHHLPHCHSKQTPPIIHCINAPFGKSANVELQNTSATLLMQLLRTLKPYPSSTSTPTTPKSGLHVLYQGALRPKLSTVYDDKTVLFSRTTSMIFYIVECMSENSAFPARSVKSLCRFGGGCYMLVVRPPLKKEGLSTTSKEQR